MSLFAGPVSDIGFELKGIEPSRDLLWMLAGPEGQRQFWEEAARVGLAVKDRSLSLGLDKNGRRLAPLSPLTIAARKADINPVTAHAPYSPMGRAIPSEVPLQASGGLSRTLTLLRYEVRPAGVWFYWGRDSSTGLDWGVVLRRHARGFTQRFRWPHSSWGHVPSRDVIGLSKADLAAIKTRMDRWWQANRLRLAGRTQERVARPSPKPARTTVDLGRSTFMHEGDRAKVAQMISRGARLNIGGVRQAPGGPWGNPPTAPVTPAPKRPRPGAMARARPRPRRPVPVAAPPRRSVLDRFTSALFGFFGGGDADAND